jgi:hypothetical protein
VLWTISIELLLNNIVLYNISTPTIYESKIKVSPERVSLKIVRRLKPMRYYSDELKKFFDTEEECKKAESLAQTDKQLKKVKKTAMAKAVEEAETSLDNAYKEFEDAKKRVEELQKEFDAKVAEIQQEYDSQVDAIMNPARGKVKECLKTREDAIKSFNKEFGTYTTTYTGDKAFSMIDKLLESFFNFI